MQNVIANVALKHTTGKKDAKGSTEDHDHVTSVRSMLIHIERQQAEILDHLGVGASNAA